MLEKKRNFSGSRIKPQLFPKSSGLRYTNFGKLYGAETSDIRGWVYRRTKNRKNRITVMAFCRNHYVKYRELPSREQLQKVFPFLKK